MPPPTRGVKVRAFSHLLGETEIALFGRADLARKVRRGFPGSLAEVPMLLPAENTVLRRSLDQWFDASGIRPNVVAEFEDSALMKVFGLRGRGAFPAASIIATEIEREYRVRQLGLLPGVHERLYAVTVERRIKHPAVMAICDAARTLVFPGESPGRRRRPTSA